jgi:hypothetical protein
MIYTHILSSSAAGLRSPMELLPTPAECAMPAPSASRDPDSF